MKAAALFSGGKDSLYALHILEKQGVTVNHLVTLTHALPRPSPHAENVEALKIIAASMRKDLTIVDFQKERAFIETLESFKVDALIAGDIDGEAHRLHLEDVCSKLGLKLLEPLYGRNTLELFHEIFSSGFKALVTGVNLKFVGEEMLGFVIDKSSSVEFLSRIRDADALGEYGEFHTLVLECPLYSRAFELESSEKLVAMGMAYLVVSVV